MTNRLIPWLAGAAMALLVCLPPVSAQTAKSGSIPRTADGKPDLSGVWDHPFAIDMGKDGRNDACGAQMKGCSQKGPGEPLPLTPWGAEMTKSYDASKFDPTGHCNPMGYTRSVNAPVPTEIVQTPKEIVFLHESMFAFHVAYLDGRKHPTAEEARETTWYGHSIGHWEGDTLVIDTVGPFFESPRMLLDTAGHPVSENLHLIERFRRMDATHLAYEITVDDPKVFTKPWKNTRVWVLMPKGEEIMEYVCNENNKEVEEHHIN